MNMPFKLSKADRESAVWKQIEAHLSAKLEQRRIQNDGDRSAEDTARLRGRIAEIKELLAIGQDDAVDREAD